MKLSSHTTSVLKNFATINQNLVIKEGNSIATMSAMKNIVAKAEVEETFPQEIAIYDLNEFLGALSLFSSPILDFNDSYVMISEETKPTTKMKYFYSDPSVVTTPKTEISMPSVDATFTLTKDTFNKVLKAAAVLGAPDMVLDIGGDSIMDLRVSDRKNDTSNSFSIEVGAESPAKGKKFYFKVENLKLLPGDYEVEVSEKGISRFKNVSKDVEYYIALETA